jgi:hypothetical protein
MIYHLAGEPQDGVQRCQRCGAVIIDYTEAQMVETGELRPMFFPSGRLVQHEGPAWTVAPRRLDPMQVGLHLCRFDPALQQQ